MRHALVILALIGLTRAAWPQTPDVLPKVTLAGGTAAAVPGTGITLVLTKVEDSRCPGEVDCVWEGMIRVELTVSAAGIEERIALCNLCDDAADHATAAGWAFGLIGLAPPTEALAELGRSPQLADYQLTVSFGPAG